MKFRNLGDMLLKSCASSPEKAAYLVNRMGNYEPVSYATFLYQVKNMASGLKKMGLKKGDKVALIMNNRIEWSITDYACQVSGLITVPIYPTLLPHHISYIVNNAEAKILFAENDYQWEKINPVRNELATVKHYVMVDGCVSGDQLPFSQLLKDGEGYLEKNPDWIEAMVESVQPDEVATLVYTSGTTGEPKGVMLTHGNFLSNIYYGLMDFEILESDTFLSFLPLSHIFERTAGHYLPMHQCATIAFAENIETVAQNMQQVRPTVMTAVPRFYEKIYGRILTAVNEGSPVKRLIFNRGIAIGRTRLEYIQTSTPVPAWLNFMYKIAFKLVFHKLLERVGGRIRFFISGGAPLAKEIGEFFAAAGLIILEGYGLTETSPVISVNHLDKFRFGTVGIPLREHQVKIAEDGEILTKGPHVMRGYYKDPQTTNAAIDKDGWLHTGDIGFFDKDGFLVITDRKKNIIVTSGGNNIAPQPIENRLITSPYIEQAVVIGNKQKYCTALIVPNLDRLKTYALENDIEYGNDENLLENMMIRNIIQREINYLCKDLAPYEAIQDFALISKPFTLENEELTPSLKTKRSVVEGKYKEIIDKLYKAR